MPNLIESLMGMVDASTLSSIAGTLGESEGAVAGGLKSAGASMLGAIGQRSGDTGFLNSILGLLGNPALAGGAASLLGGGSNAAVSSLGSQFLGLLFGGQQSGVTAAIAQAAGLRGASASNLLAIAAPLVMSFLGGKAKAEGLGAAGLGRLLAAELPNLQGLIPAGVLSMAMPSLPSMQAPEVPANRGWLLPLLLIAAAGLGLLWYLNQGAEPMKEAAHEAAHSASTAAHEAASSAASTVNAAWAALGEFFKRKLPNGIELSIPQLGVENKLVDFIESSAPVDRTTWFDFDRLLFDTGKATLQPESQEQLKNVAEILKAFPNVNIKIGGYTDNTGNPAANMQLSAARAATVMNELAGMGIDKARLESEGYGEEHPVAPNDTEEGRQKNRRVSMRVTKK
ncbi:MAG: OmpA family protein [Bryobacteraceae bacterium]